VFNSKNRITDVEATVAQKVQ